MKKCGGGVEKCVGTPHFSNEYFCSFVCHDAHKHRENICCLVIIKDSTHKRFQFSNKRQTNIFSPLSAKQLKQA